MAPQGTERPSAQGGGGGGTRVSANQAGAVAVGTEGREGVEGQLGERLGETGHGQACRVRGRTESEASKVAKWHVLWTGSTECVPRVGEGSYSQSLSIDLCQNPGIRFPNPGNLPCSLRSFQRSLVFETQLPINQSIV